jgi:hypothetical protein
MLIGLNGREPAYVMINQCQLQTKRLYAEFSLYTLKGSTLSYSLPKQITERLKVKGVRFYFTDKTFGLIPVFKFTKDIDPEQMILCGYVYLCLII